MPDHVVAEGVPVSRVHPDRVFAFQIVDENVHHRVGPAGLGIGLDVDGALDLGLT